MNDILKKALNRGAPIDTPIMINIHDLLKVLQNGELYNDYRENIADIVSGISNIMGMYSGNFTLPMYATITSDEYGRRELRFSGENYYETLIELLRGKMNNMTDKEVEKVITDKEGFQVVKEELLSINNKNDLQEKYPRIYELYEEEIESNRNFLTLDEILKDENTPFEVKLNNKARIINNFTKFYSNFSLERELMYARSFSLKTYLERMANAIERYIANAEEIINLYYTHKMNMESLKTSDIDKLNLYIAAEFVNKIEKVPKDEKQRYLFYLTNYFKDNVETEIKRVKIKFKEKNINPIRLYEKYKKVLLENPELLAVNFKETDFKDMTKEEIEEFILEYLKELRANWTLIPENDNSVEKTVRKIAERKYRNISLEDRKKKEAKLMSLYMSKKNFYDKTDPYFRIKGKNTFDGYVGYIYSNGIVVLEKFYDNVKTGRIAENEAIYIINMKDFYELSQYSKTHLISNHLCRRVIHGKGWQDRVLKHINKETNKDPSIETTKLIEDKKVYVKKKKSL